MTQQEAEMKIKAAAYAVAAELGAREAVEMLQQVAREIDNAQWSGPGSR